MIPQSPPASLWSPLSGTDKEKKSIKHVPTHNFNQRKILNLGDHFPCFRPREITVRVKVRLNENEVS